MGVLLSLQMVGWAKAAEAPANVHDVRSAVPTRVKSDAWARRSGRMYKVHEHRGRLCPPYQNKSYFTVTVIVSDITGGTCGMWLQSPSTSCSVCSPGGSVTIASVWPPPKCMCLASEAIGAFCSSAESLASMMR